MILGYGNAITRRTTAITYTNTVLTSLAFLKDGRPGGLCSLQHTANEFLVTTWLEPIALQVAAVINTNLQEGYSIQFTARIAGSFVPLGSRQVQTLASGDKCAFLVLDEPLENTAELFYGFGPATVSPVTIGELWASPALPYCIRSDWQSGIGAIGKDVSLSGAVYTAPSVPRRTIDATIAPRVYGNDFDKLREAQLAINDDPRVVVVPDRNNVTRTAMYARATTIGSLQGDARGQAFSQRYVFEEMPGRAPAFGQ